MSRLREVYDRLKPNHLDTGDRGTLHSYIQLYEILAAPFRTQPCQVLELGVLHGHGVMLWSEYFEHAKVIGVDRQDHWGFPEVPKNVQLFLDVNMTLGDQMAPVLELGPFDLVFEDGSHHLREQVRTLDMVWPTVREGGFYVIEDVQEPDALRYMMRDREGFLGLVDFRALKGRYDDVVAVFHKEVQGAVQE